jgi:hypothetical protein
MITSALIAFASAAQVPAALDHPYPNRMIVEVLPYWAVRERCKGAIDISPGGFADACSWSFPDPQNPGKLACHVVYPRLSDDWSVDDEVRAIRVETANCNLAIRNGG